MCKCFSALHADFLWISFLFSYAHRFAFSPFFVTFLFDYPQSTKLATRQCFECSIGHRYFPYPILLHRNIGFILCAMTSTNKYDDDKRIDLPITKRLNMPARN